MIGRANIEAEFLKNNVDTIDSHLDIFRNTNEIESGIVSSADVKMSGFRNRFITKYIVPVNFLEEIIYGCYGKYKLLERYGNLQSDIFLEYYDTAGLKFFNDHVNGKLNRIKVRMRSCCKTENRIWEIWRRKSKGRMVKKRVLINGSIMDFEEKASFMVSCFAGIDFHSLSPSLLARFKRITLLNPEAKERITIDTSLSFAAPDQPEKQTPIPGLAIIEIRKRRRANSFLADMLAGHSIRPSKFSKYCLGITLTNQNAKTNSYKPILRSIEKTITYGYVE